MTISDLINKAKRVKNKAVVVGKNVVTTVQKKQAAMIEQRVQWEVAEAKRLDRRLKDLKAQDKREALRGKNRKQIAELESKLTTRGKILTKLGKDAVILGRVTNKAAGILGNEVTKLIKSGTKKAKVLKKRRRKKRA